LSIKNKVLFGLLLMTLLLASLSAAIISNLPIKPPLIQGVLIADAVDLKPFTIVDHHNNIFSNEQLKGKWHLLSYGYTHCPDVCPTVLAILSKFNESLKLKEQFSNLQVLFYSIDHQRDTAAHLSEYLPYFNKDFTGLTYLDSMRLSAEAFERSLGMLSILTPVQSTATTEESNSFSAYTVSHGFVLYLINPKGRLQAVLKPNVNQNGSLYFTEQQILEDYVAIRRYLTKIDKTLD